MAWLIAFFIIAALPVWMLLAPVEVRLDTRVPAVLVRWKSIGWASLFFENDNFWLQVQLPFWHRRWPLAELLKKRKKAKPKEAKSKKVSVKKKSNKISFRKAIQLMKCIRIKQCEWVLCPNDFVLTAQLYPLNFITLPHPYKLSVGFVDESYLLLHITTAPWRVVYTWWRN